MKFHSIQEQKSYSIHPEKGFSFHQQASACKTNIILKKKKKKIRNYQK